MVMPVSVGKGTQSGSTRTTGDLEARHYVTWLSHENTVTLIYPWKFDFIHFGNVFIQVQQMCANSSFVASTKVFTESVAFNNLLQQSFAKLMKVL